MSNDYYNWSSGALVKYTLARTAALANQFAGITAGFNKLPDAAVLRENRHLYIVAGGTANALTGTMPHTALSAYVAGLTVNVKIAVNNTGPVTLNIDGLGVKQVLNVGGGALGANDLVADAVVSMKYNGTAFTVDSTASAASVASATAVAAAAAASSSASAAAASAVSAAASAASVDFTLSSASILTNKTINLTSNTLVATLAQINAAVSDADLVSLAGSETLTNKVINLTSNTLVATLEEVNAAVSDADLVSLAGSETLTNKSINLASNKLTGTLAQFSTALSDDDFVGRTSTQTLTNKRLEPRIGTTASSATPTPSANTDDQYNVTALAAGATFAAPSGTPTDGQKLTLRIKDNGTARTLAFNAIYRAIGVTLPTTTVISKTIYIGCIYNAADTKWDVVSVAQEA